MQTEYVGEGNNNIGESYDGWIDLFGWGTSGHDHGAVCYQPWSISEEYSDYFAYGQYTYYLNDQSGEADWGYNPISNGGDVAHIWRALTHDEWRYVFNIRNTSSGIRYAKANVNETNGVILLPDNWNSSYYELDNTNRTGANFDDNNVSKSDWNTKLAAYGAVFLPNAGSRKANDISGIGKDGYYWSSTNYDSSGAFAVYIYDRNVNSAKHYYHKNGFSVRLVR